MAKLLKTFRVFISSTFSDMREERQILQKKVFPELENHCISRGARFQAVDLRWGVTEASQLEQKTLDICLSEIKRCQQVSPKPNFLILLGDRYGWQPIPTKVPLSEMQDITNILDQEDKGIIQKWYRCDENAIPAEYVLQPREKENIDIGQWEKTESVIRQIFRNAVPKLDFEKDQQNKYFCSATHLEIINGALKTTGSTKSTGEHAFAYVREIDGLPHDKTAKDFIDLHGDMQDAYSSERLGELKTELKSKLSDNCRNYKTNWNGQKSYIADPEIFANKILNDLLSIINKQIDETIIPDVLQHEIHLHEDFKNSRAEFFSGREDALDGIYNYINSTDNIPYLLTGLSGSGKSAVMAQAIKNAEESNHSAVIVYRFAGITSSSSDIISLLKSICKQITKAYAIDHHQFAKDYTMQDTEDEMEALSEIGLAGLYKLFARCLSFSSKEKPLWLFIDALDQMGLQDSSNELYWLPISLEPNTKLIVSALPEFARILIYCQNEKLGRLPESDALKILNKWFHAINRQLIMTQQDRLISNFKINGLPIYLKLAFENAQNWKSYTEVFSLSSSVDGLINDLMDRLEKEHSSDFVRNVISYVLSGRYQGLAENEILEILAFDKDYWNNSFLKQTHPSHRKDLEDVLKIPIVVWSRLFLDLEPYLTVRDAYGYPVISFFHKQFISSLEKRYIGTLDTQVAYHQKMADYFENYAIENRKVMELPWHLMQSNQWERLSRTIGNRHLFNAVYELYKPDLHNYWSQIEKHSSIKLSDIDHQKILSTLDYEIADDLNFSRNQSIFFYERKQYQIAITFLEDLAIYQQEVFFEIEADDLIETLNYLYLNFAASKNWDAAIQTCLEILEIDSSMDLLLKQTMFEIDIADDISLFKKKLANVALSPFSRVFKKASLLSSSMKITGLIADLYTMKNQPELALRWYDYQYRINTKTRFRVLPKLLLFIFKFIIPIGLKIYNKFTKSEQDVLTKTEYRQSYSQNVIDECIRMVVIGRVYMHKSKYSKAINYFNKAKKISKEYELSKEIIKCTNLLANCYFKKGDIIESLQNFEEARRFYESTLDFIELENVYEKMAEAYEQLKELQKAEKILEANTKILKFLGDDEKLWHTYDTLYRVTIEMQETNRAKTYKDKRDTINIATIIANSNELQQKKSIFGREMLSHQQNYNNAETHFKSERYDEAKSILSDLKCKIITYQPPKNNLSIIESLLRRFVKKPGYLAGVVFAFLQIGLVICIVLLNKLTKVLQLEELIGVLAVSIALVYLVSTIVIEKRNFKKSSFIFGFTLIISSTFVWVIFTSDDFPFNRFLGVALLFCFFYVITYVAVSIFKILIINIKKRLRKRIKKSRLRKLDFNDMHPFILRNLMKCIRLEGDIYYSGFKEYEAAFEKFIELEKISKIVADKTYLLKAQYQQLAYYIDTKKDLKPKKDLAIQIENSILQAEKDYEYGVKGIYDELYYGYLTLKLYYSRLGQKDKVAYYKEKMNNLK